MEFLAKVKDKVETIESRLESLLPSEDNELYQAARYSVLGGGKRIRPLLAILTTEALEGDLESVLTPACALEMIHAYSLIHDDLPCMDNDDFRRGKPSLHKKYNEAHALLTGDYLLTYSFEIIATSPYLQAEQKVEIIELLSQRAGGSGMVGGQVLDIQSTALQISLDRLLSIHAKKTGALLQAAVEFGAICGNASKSVRTSLAEFGKEIGLAFQIVDDILDVTSIKEKRGTTVSSDQENNKTTFVTLMGIPQAQKYAEIAIKKGIKALDCLGSKGKSLIHLAEYLQTRTK